MGKTRARRGRAARADPTGKGDAAEGMEEEGAGDARGDTLANIVEQLKSVSTEERLCGCLTLSQLPTPELTLEVLQRHRLVRLVGPLLVDACVSTRQAAAGALRNLSLGGGKEACDLMLEQDVLTSLFTAFGKYSEGWKTQRKVEKSMVLLDADSEIFVQIANLLWNLCEASDKAVTAVNQSGVCRTLLRCLDLSAYPAEVVLPAGQCLHALSEDNAAVSALVTEQLPLVRALLAAEGEDSHRRLLRVLALGILINVSGDDADLRPGQVMTLISRTLAPDARELACRVTSNTEADDYELQLTELSLLLTAQQVALELLTDYSGGEDVSDGWVDQEAEDADDEDNDTMEDMQEMMEDDACQMDGDTTSLSSELQEAVVGEGLLTRTLAKADCPPANVSEILQQTTAGQQIDRRFRTLRCRVFLCLNNLISALELRDLGGEEQLVALWRRMVELVLAETDGDAALLESAGAAMRAALQKLLDAGLPGPADLTVTSLQQLTARVRGCADPGARAGLVRGVGLLGCLRVKEREALPAADRELVQAIGQFLVELAAADTELAVVAEALDVLMDLFGEDCTDAAAAHIQLVAKLRALQPGLKAKMSLQRRRAAQNYPLVATVRTNLPRFIKYKAARVAAVQVNGNSAH